MANEDVLKILEDFVDHKISLQGPPLFAVARKAIAALREAREELGVLRSKAMQLDVGNAVKAAIRESNAEIAALDAAMKPPGGEGSSHE